MLRLIQLRQRFWALPAFRCLAGAVLAEILLTVPSSTVGPRLVCNFLTDRANQFVFGAFLGSFRHSLLVFFINHISESIQIATLSARLRRELVDTVERLCPQAGHEQPDEETPATQHRDLPDAEGEPVGAARNGHILDINVAKLLRIASSADAVVALQVRPGSHVITGDPGAVAGHERSFTAINAIDDLTAGLALMAAREQPTPGRYDESGQFRVVPQLCRFPNCWGRCLRTCGSMRLILRSSSVAAWCSLRRSGIERTPCQARGVRTWQG